MKKETLTIFLFLIYFFSFGNNPSTKDSLLHVLNQKGITKKEKVLALSSLANNAIKIEDSFLFLNEALQLSIQINDPVLKAQILEEISYVENRLGNISKALKTTFKALKIYETHSLEDKKAASYAQIAALYVTEKNYTSAIAYLRKAQKIYNNTGDIKDKILVTINLGEVYRLLNDLDNAEMYFLKALKLNKSVNETNIKGYTLGNLGMVYNKQEKLSLAQDNLQKAIILLQGINDFYASSIYLAELAITYKKQHKLLPAENTFIKAYKIAKEHGFKEEIRDFSKYLFSFYKQEEKFKEAFKYQEIYQIYQDSLINKESIKEIEQIKSRYVLDKKETQITLLNTINKNQKYTVIGLVIGLLTLILMSYFLYKGNKKTKKINQLLVIQKNLISKREQEKAILLKELNHRTKNNLQMISSLLNLQSNKLSGHPAQDAILSGKYRVEALSLVHRKLYQESVDSKINIKEYIEELILGLFYGYNANFSPELNIAPVDIHIDTAVPLALIINELIINALKYAYETIENPKLKINIQQSNNESLLIDIEDNGIGFDLKKEENQHSFGLKLLNSLVQQLKGSIEQIAGKGTHWKIHLQTI